MYAYDQVSSLRSRCLSNNECAPFAFPNTHALFCITEAPATQATEFQPSSLVAYYLGTRQPEETT